MQFVDKLAQEIRRVDGNHSLGAGALAEALMPFIEAALSAAPTAEPGQDVPQELADRCRDVLEWKKTGLLPDGALRALAKKLDETVDDPFGVDLALRVAEKQTAEESMRFVLAAASLLKAADDGFPPFKPCIHVNDLAGISEMLLEDCATITGQEMVVRPLLRMSEDKEQRDIVGFQWDSPYSKLPQQPSPFAKSPEGQELAADVAGMAERVGVKFVPFVEPVASEMQEPQVHIAPSEIWKILKMASMNSILDDEHLPKLARDIAQLADKSAPSLQSTAAVPAAWTTKESFEALQTHPKMASSMWGKPNGRINVPLFAAPPLPKEDGLREVEAFAEKAISAIKDIANPDLGNKFVLVGPSGILAMACNAVRAALHGEGSK